MIVKDLIEHLRTFDDNLSVIVRNESLQIELPIEEVRWEYDGYCKIIIDEE